MLLVCHEFIPSEIVMHIHVLTSLFRLVNVMLTKIVANLILPRSSDDFASSEDQESNNVNCRWLEAKDFVLSNDGLPPSHIKKRVQPHQSVSLSVFCKMTLSVDAVDTKGGTANGTSGGGSTHPPLFDSPSKRGIHHTVATFIPTEQRFRWQAGAGETDAMYTLPTSIGSSPKKSFGNSTREDWDFARKRADPGAGPGSYEPAMSCGKQVSSERRSVGSTAFENAPRAPLQENTTPSPGPIYDLPPVMGRGSSAPKQGTSLRPPLHGKSVSPGPNIMLKSSFKECRTSVSPTFGSEVRLRPIGSQQTPGPIYDLRPTGYLTGPRSSFSHAKRF